MNKSHSLSSTEKPSKVEGRSDQRDLALAIGVGDAQPLKYLSGAINGARAFHHWASKLGYDARLLIDDEEPVTIEQLSSKLLAMLPSKGETVHRLVLYFAGHGIIREVEESLWLLSDWHKTLRAVAVEPLKRRLSVWYNIQQIAIFSDSCQSLPPDITAADLTADAVLGRGPYKAVTQPEIDRFLAAQDGSATFMVPGKSPEEDRCLFSGVLMEGLWGMRAEAFSKAQKDSITGRSLGQFLKVAVPTLAKRYNRDLIPRAIPTFSEGDDVYFSKGLSLTPPEFPEWPSAEVVMQAMGTREIDERSIQAPEPVFSPGQGLIEQIRSQPGPQWFGTGAGIAVQGGRVRDLWTPPKVFAKRSQQDNWWEIGERTESRYLNHPAPVLVEFEDGTFAPTTALTRFIARILRDEGGISALIYRPMYEPDNATPVKEKALAAMENGQLRVEAWADLAVGLRQEKHYDPVLGVISAYLYDAIGDVGNIRRMAYYYIHHKQPIPYDIALLGLIPGEWRGSELWAHVPAVPKQEPRTADEKKYEWTYAETPAALGEVGGLWPWMRQGWTFLDDPLDDESMLIRPGLIQLIPHLKAGRFALLDTDGGQRIAQLFNLSPQHER